MEMCTIRSSHSSVRSSVALKNRRFTVNSQQSTVQKPAATPEDSKLVEVEDAPPSLLIISMKDNKASGRNNTNTAPCTA